MKNFYINAAPTGRYERLVCLVVTHEGKTAGRVTEELAHALIVKGVAMDMRQRSQS